MAYAVAYIIEFFIGDHRETHGTQSVQSLRMACIFILGAVLHIKADDIQPALCGHFRVKLAHGAGRCISRVCQQRLAVLFPLGVKL